MKNRAGVIIPAFLPVFFLTTNAGLAHVGPNTMPEGFSEAFEVLNPPVRETRIDKFVFGRLAKMGIQPVFCSDAVFIRRVYLDVIGTLPTAQETREFLDDADTRGKRSRLIDKLLERKEFSDYWAMKWSDILRIKAEFPVNLWPEAAQAYYQWVRSSISENKPYDRFVREMLTASGSNFRNGPVNFYRAIQNRTPEGIAAAVALTFMGTRTDTWDRKSADAMKTFFSQVGYKPTREWKEEIVFWDTLKTDLDKKKADSAKPGEAKSRAAAGAVLVHSAEFPDGTIVELRDDTDPRELFADWLVTSKNPWFKRAIVNRIWYWLLGRGIIQEPDDIRPDNPPCNPELLAYLEKELVSSHYDLKHIYRLILNSDTYQLSSFLRSRSEEAESNFASYPIRRLDAEVLIDAINKVTGSSDQYTSPIPEPFTYIPEDMSAIGIGDGSITSSFLMLFGRSARSTGMANERDNKAVPAQWLHLLNSSHIQRKLEQGPKIKAIIDSKRKPEDIIQELYLTVLSRYPTANEGTAALNYPSFAAKATQAKSAAPAAAKDPARDKNASAAPAIDPSRDKTGGSAQTKDPSRTKTVPFKRSDWVDIVWSLLNSTEFLYRH